MPLALPADVTVTGVPAGAALFGGNILAPRTAMTGEGSYAEAIAALNVTGLRYPGGSLTEYYFDLAEPDAATASHAETGAETAFIPLSEFMAYAGQAGHAVTLVLPTRDQLSGAVDATGNRLPQIDEEVLRDFVHDLASGTYGEAEIAALEIGNEYWGSGEMTAVEYGRLAARMAEIIADELALVAEVMGTDTSEIRVLAQMGQNYGVSRISDGYAGWEAEEIIADLAQTYPGAGLTGANIRGNGEVNWSEVTNALVRMGFETEAQQEALDGVIAHVYARGTEDSRSYDLDTIHDTWLAQEGFEHLEVHVTEWNLKSSDNLDAESDYGLLQAQEMLEIVEEFLEAGVDQAHVWPLIQNTANALSTGVSFEAITVPGEMFAMMAAALPGKALLDFTPGGASGTEAQDAGLDVHGFAGAGDLVLYVTSHAGEVGVTDLDLSGLLTGFAGMEITLLGVAEGELPGDAGATPRLETRDPGELYGDGLLEVALAPHEILQVVIRDVAPTEAFAPILAGIDAEAGDTAPEAVLPLIDLAESEDAEPPAADDDTQEDSGWGNLGFLLALLPLAGLLAG
ncbi:type I secretion protein [Yangia mangrovi]|uniref:Type I secretion protein n=1 Tax=Alloyangia mangrovi TaxID=1779329 RepID=A0A2A3JRL4_9RHOB|nr:type I secretion protein [Alloyangia mangrovi]MCT4372629.1 type I secretion protein [Alloyangia mangrovi]